MKTYKINLNIFFKIILNDLELNCSIIANKNYNAIISLLEYKEK